MVKVLSLLFSLFLTLGCADYGLRDYKNNEPKLDLTRFFDGELYALGIVQDRSGKVIKRFKVKMNASWIGNVAILDEDFIYSDGSKSKRVWKLRKVRDSFFSGEADDVEGKAKGEVSGNTFYFEYVLNLPVGDSTYRVKFEDWMYLLDDNTLLARSYMKKWGLSLGEVTIVMMKKEN
jgi:hypothetical protein